MPESPPVNTNISAGTAETVLASTNPQNQGPVNVDNPNAPGVIPQVIIDVFYQFVWGATTTTLTLRCRRGIGTGGAEVLLPNAGRPIQQGPAAATPGLVRARWVDTNVPAGTQYTVTGQAGTAAVTGAGGYVSTDDCT